MLAAFAPLTLTRSGAVGGVVSVHGLVATVSEANGELLPAASSASTAIA